MQICYEFRIKSLILALAIAAFYSLCFCGKAYSQEDVTDGTWTNHYHLGSGQLAFDETTGKMWLGTGAGLIEFELPPIAHSRYTKADGLPSHSISSIAIGQSGHKWINTLDGLLHIEPSGRWNSFYSTNARLNTDGELYTVAGLVNRKISTDTNGNAWLGAQIKVSNSRWEEGVLKLSVDGENSFYLKDETGSSGPIANINVISADKETGNIYFGTDNGVSVLYPSGQWSVISHFNNNNVQNITVDSNGNIWVISRKLLDNNEYELTLLHLTNGNLIEHRTSGASGLQNLSADDDGNVWVETYNSVLRYGITSSQWVTYTQQADGLLSLNISSIEPDSQGNMWFSTPTGFMRFTSQETWEMYPYSDEYNYTLVPNTVYDIKAHDEGIWFGTFNFHYFSDNRWADPPIESEPWAEVREIEFTADGSIWVTHYTGVTRIAPDGSQICPNANELCDSTVYDIYEDENNALWFGTSRGVYRFQDGNWETYRSEEGLIHNEVLSIAEDLDGNMWFGTTNGISVLDTNLPLSWTSYSITSTILQNDHINSIDIDQKNNKWIGTQSGVYKVSANQEIWTLFDYTLDMSTHQIYVDASDQVWLGTTNGVIQVSHDFLFQEHYLRGYDVRSIYIDENSTNWWFGTTSTGVWHYATAPQLQSDLKVEVVTEPTSPTAGGSLVYLINYSNSGDADATGVKISMTTSNTVTFSDAHSTPTTWNCDDSHDGPSCTTILETVASGSSGSVRFGVDVGSQIGFPNSEIEYLASILADDINRPDANPDDNRLVGKTEIALPLLSLHKEVSLHNPLQGDTVTYTVTVSANRDAQITLTDTLPISMTYTGLLQGFAEHKKQQYDESLNVTKTINPTTPLQLVYQSKVNTDVKPGTVLGSSVRVISSGVDQRTSASISVGQKEPIPMLVLIVANGDNNLGPYIRELMQKAEMAAANQSIVTYLYYDGPNDGDAHVYQIMYDPNLNERCPSVSDPYCDGRYQLGETVWKQDEQSSTRVEIREFLASHIEANPADKIAVVFAGHGTGISPDFFPGQPSFHEEKFGGMLWDDRPESYLSTKQLGVALNEVKARTGETIDLLYLDMCFMAVAEVAYEIRDSVDYLLASQNWSWTSFRYDRHLSVPGSLDIVQIARLWMQHEVEELTGNIAEQRPNYPFTYSLLDLRHMDEFVLLDNTLTQALIENLNDLDNGTANRSKIQLAHQSAGCFDSNQDYVIDEKDYYCDVYSFADELSRSFGATSKVGEAAQSLMSLIRPSISGDSRRNRSTLLIKEVHNNGSPWRHPENLWKWPTLLGGISKYVPLGQNDSKRAHYNNNHLQFTTVSKWDEFLTTYWLTSTIPKCTEDCRQPDGPEPLIEAQSIYLPLIAKVR